MMKKKTNKEGENSLVGMKESMVEGEEQRSRATQWDKIHDDGHCRRGGAKDRISTVLSRCGKKEKGRSGGLTTVVA